MKKIILLIMIGFLFGQTVDELRIKREKMFDLMAMSKNATHTAVRGEIDGVMLTSDQVQELLDKAVEYESLVLQLLTGVSVSEPVIEVNELKIVVDELVAGAVKYFWKSPRANSIQKVQLALIGDVSGVDYLILNYRTRIYSAHHDYVLEQLNKIKEL